jgi:hypothetical protein
MSQTAVMAVKVATEAPFPGHGETEAKPTPVPRATRTNETAAATRAPAKIAAHDTAEIVDSTLVCERKESGVRCSMMAFMGILD